MLEIIVLMYKKAVANRAAQFWKSIRNIGVEYNDIDFIFLYNQKKCQL